MSIYKGMLEASVITIDDNGEPIIPYFNESTIDYYVENYLERNIKKYVKEYTLDIDYLDKTSHELCQEDCREINLNLKAKINLFFTYDKNQTFVVRSYEELWMKN